MVEDRITRADFYPKMKTSYVMKSNRSAGLADFIAWEKSDPVLFERITRLITETSRDPFHGIGKPEPLRHQLKGFWSRRINDEHRLVAKWRTTR